MTGDGPASGEDRPGGGGNGPAGGRNGSGGGPALKVVAGDPSAEELAALTVALSAVLAARGGPALQPGRAASGWADRSRMMGAPPGPGPDAWRRSTWPR
jgi:acyl-CoA carboxylase epsilon subunit